MGDFAGVIDTWDVINEAVIMPVFTTERNGITRLAQEVGRVGMVALAVRDGPVGEPDATLLINDFDLSADYEHLLEACLEAGIRIDTHRPPVAHAPGVPGPERPRRSSSDSPASGCRSTSRRTAAVRGADAAPDRRLQRLPGRRVADRTPEGEARQAEQVVTPLQTLVAAPPVAAITWWDIEDGGWLNAPSGFLRRDALRNRPSTRCSA